MLLRASPVPPFGVSLPLCEICCISKQERRSPIICTAIARSQAIMFCLAGMFVLFLLVLTCGLSNLILSGPIWNSIHSTGFLTEHSFPCYLLQLVRDTFINA